MGKTLRQALGPIGPLYFLRFRGAFSQLFLRRSQLGVDPTFPTARRTLGTFKEPSRALKLHEADWAGRARKTRALCPCAS
eukprot:7323879-Pyramimonas_sp.AAC.1